MNEDTVLVAVASGRGVVAKKAYIPNQFAAV